MNKGQGDKDTEPSPVLGKTVASLAPIFSGLGASTLLDGPLPIVDAAATVGAVVAFTGAVGYGVYQALKPQAISIPRFETKTQKPKQYQYWSAYIVENTVVTGRGLSFVEASIYVSTGLNVMCANQGAAKTLLAINCYWNFVGPEIHGQDGYYWHYHPNRHSHVHIWYY